MNKVYIAASYTAHAPLVKLNIRLKPAPFSTHDEYHIELTNKRRYE